MKKRFFSAEHGESFSSILYYFIPEFITNFILYSMPLLLDAVFIGSLESMSTYATLGVTNNIIHFTMKIAEALSVGTVVMSGQLNGRNEYRRIGETVRDAFWITCVIGIFFSALLYGGAHAIYAWYGVNAEVIHLGVPFIRMRALGVLFMFIYLALVGFLRGIKNTQSPMKIFVVGALLFIFFDYALVFGKYGFPVMGLQGSAIATIIQYGFMLIVATGYVVCNKKNRKYGIELFSVFTNVAHVKQLLRLSWPVVLDKATIAMAYVWLGKMIAPMGTCSIAAFCAIKDIERCAFLPALAFAQVATLLVSNDYGARDWEAIRSNLKKIVFLAAIMVFSILLLFSCYPKSILIFFDKKGEFSNLAAYALPFISTFVVFDLLQLILSGVLRGAGNVRVVMIVRLVVCFCYFLPFSYIISHTAIQDERIKLVLIYGSFYVGSALMSAAYINRLRGECWKIPSIE